MVFRPNCTDKTRERLAPFRGGGTWDDAINAVIDKAIEKEWAGGPRPEVRWFAGEMEKKLRENDHKGGWRDTCILHLNYRLDLEKVELNDAVRLGEVEKIISEAADVANFAMMIADLAQDPPKNSSHEYLYKMTVEQDAPEEGEDEWTPFEIARRESMAGRR